MRAPSLLFMFPTLSIKCSIRAQRRQEFPEEFGNCPFITQKQRQGTGVFFPLSNAGVWSKSGTGRDSKVSTREASVDGLVMLCVDFRLPCGSSCSSPESEDDVPSTQCSSTGKLRPACADKKATPTWSKEIDSDSPVRSPVLGFPQATSSEMWTILFPVGGEVHCPGHN